MSKEEANSAAREALVKLLDSQDERTRLDAAATLIAHGK